LRKQTKRILDQLAESMIGEPQEWQPQSTLFPKMGRIPPQVTQGNKEVEWLTITDEDLRLYLLALDALARETELQHLTRQDIDPILWEAACDLFVNRARYKEPRVRSQRMQQMVDQIPRELEAFEVLIEIEHLSVAASRIAIAGCELFRLAESTVAKWRVAPHPGRSAVNELSGKTVALVRVEAGSPNKAASIARNRVDTALNMLRVCLSTVPRHYLPDFQMLMRQGQVLAVRAVNGSGRALESWELAFSPKELSLAGPLLTGVRHFLQHLEPLVKGTLSNDLQEQLLRALEWIGTSVTREHADDKVVDLCTALEAMLTTRDEGRKGEAVALRQMLLSLAINRPIRDPIVVYGLYDLRSRIVHGSARRVSGRHEYLWLRQAAISILVDILAFVQDSPHIRSTSALVASLKTEQRLKDAIDWLGGQQGRFAKDIAKFAHQEIRS
jgi:hypothetical protein